jgi:phosphate starvation-inducible protein PhoH and related proteins
MRNKKTREIHRLVDLEAKTPNQKEYIRSIIENDVVCCSGPAGSGKSFIAAGIAAHRLHHGVTERIIVTRPLVCTGKDLGSMPGEMNEKIAPYLLPMKENLQYFLTPAFYGHYENNKAIQYRPLEVMRGSTFHDSYMILDEAQNCTVDQIKMFISRMGKNSKVLINGDINQNDLRGRSGLEFVMNKLERIDGCGVCHLTYDDIQRHDLIGRILNALEN